MPRSRRKRARTSQSSVALQPRSNTAKKEDTETRRTPIVSRPTQVWRIWQIVWGVTGPIASLIGLFFLLRPTVTIEPTASLDRSQALATQFKVMNTSHVPVYNVHFRCEYGFPLSFGNPGLDMTGTSFALAPVLSPGRTITRSCADPSSRDVGTPNMRITTFYEWPLIGKTDNIPAFFRVVKGNEGYFLLPDEMPIGWSAGLTLNGPRN
jgi:hypothetical protein